MTVTIMKHWHDESENVGYAEGKLGEREFTASWATWCPICATFYDNWLDSSISQDKAIATSLRKLNALPSIQVACVDELK